MRERPKADCAEAFDNRGLALRNAEAHGAAIADFRRAIALRPDFASAYWNKSVTTLLRGKFVEGWELYEWRWKRPDLLPPDFPPPLWLGREDAAGKKILLHAEQGFGDTIQFCRYAPLLAVRRATVVLEIQPAL